MSTTALEEYKYFAQSLSSITELLLRAEHAIDEGCPDLAQIYIDRLSGLFATTWWPTKEEDREQFNSLSSSLDLLWSYGARKSEIHEYED